MTQEKKELFMPGNGLVDISRRDALLAGAALTAAMALPASAPKQHHHHPAVNHQKEK